MAVRRVFPNVRSSFNGYRHRSSVTAAAAEAVESEPFSLPNKLGNRGEVDSILLAEAAGKGGYKALDLSEAANLFGEFSTGKLLRSTAVLEAAATDPLVDAGIRVMKSWAMKTPGAKGLILGGLRHTFYDHFCAGENNRELVATVRQMWESGLRAMLVYGVEDVDDEASCDNNLVGFLRTVNSAMLLPPSSASFVIVKITAICPMPLLRRVSDLLRWEHRDTSTRLPWKHATLPLFSDSSPLYHTSERPEPLSPEEESQLERAHERLTVLCENCLEANVPLTVDAEYTSVQPAIDYFTYAAAIQYNRGHSPIVFGTIQAYLKDAQERLFLAATAAEKMGVPMGIKLVRGAYMSSEATEAAAVGSDTPIHRCLQDTHDCYNACAAFMLDRIAQGRVGDAVVLATHNVESGKLAAARARDLGIEKDNERLQFAQLYGMSEALSRGLRNAGFVVSKYTPFGPVEMVMPYLIRRAEENRGMLSTSALDRVLMRQELKRRLTKFYSG